MGAVGLQLSLGVRLMDKMHHHLNYSAVENRATVCSVTNSWERCALPTFALPNRTATLRVWVELLSAGTVWIDLAQLAVKVQ